MSGFYREIQEHLRRNNKTAQTPIIRDTVKLNSYRQHEKDKSCHPQHQDLLVAFTLSMKFLVIWANQE